MQGLAHLLSAIAAHCTGYAQWNDTNNRAYCARWQQHELEARPSVEAPKRPLFFSREPILLEGGCKQRANGAAVWRPKVVFGDKRQCEADLLESAAKMWLAGNAGDRFRDEKEERNSKKSNKTTTTTTTQRRLPFGGQSVTSDSGSRRRTRRNERFSNRGSNLPSASQSYFSSPQLSSV